MLVKERGRRWFLRTRVLGKAHLRTQKGKRDQSGRTRPLVPAARSPPRPRIRSPSPPSCATADTPPGPPGIGARGRRGGGGGGGGLGLQQVVVQS